MKLVVAGARDQHILAAVAKDLVVNGSTNDMLDVNEALHGAGRQQDGTVVGTTPYALDVRIVDRIVRPTAAINGPLAFSTNELIVECGPYDLLDRYQLGETAKSIGCCAGLQISYDPGR